MASIHGLRAITGPMNTARLQFAVEFAQLDLDALSPGDWLNLRADLCIFLHSDGTDTPKAQIEKLRAGTYAPHIGHGGIVAHAHPGPAIQELSVDALTALQAETLTLLTDVVESRILATGAKYQMHPVPISATTWAISSLDGHPVSAGTLGRNALAVQGPAREVFLLVLLLLLKDQPTDRVLRCPSCQLLFCRSGKQVYCSRRCVNLATVRTWRATPGGQQKEKARGRARYQQRKARARGDS